MLKGSLGTDDLVSIQSNTALLWGALQMLWYLPCCSLCLVSQELESGAAAAACFWCQGSTQKTTCEALLFGVRSCQDIANYDSLLQTRWVCSRQGSFSLSRSLFAPCLLQIPSSMLNACLRKPFAQPGFVVPASRVLKWRLSKKPTKPMFC